MNVETSILLATPANVLKVVLLVAVAGAVAFALRNRGLAKGKSPAVFGLTLLALVGGMMLVRMVTMPAALPAAYEKARSSKGRMSILVGPNRVQVVAVARRGPQGAVLAGNGLGRPVKAKDLNHGFASHTEYRDLVNIRFEPEGRRFDILETRVFDHATRELMPSGDVSATLLADGSILQLRRAEERLPEVIDLWLQLHSHGRTSEPQALPRDVGAHLTVRSASIRVRELRPGVAAHTMRSAAGHVGEIAWDEESVTRTNEACTAVFDLEGTWEAGRYQVCAVDQAGAKHWPDVPRYVEFREGGRTRVIQFPLPLGAVRHFEWRPFGGRHRIYFDGLQLPKLRDAFAR
jgi:hypothetical protein